MTDRVPHLLVFGAGRMGSRVARLAGDSGFRCIGMISRTPPENLDDISWAPGFDALSQTPDIVVDFSLPGGMETVAGWCASRGIPLVSGTTGLDDHGRAALRDAGSRCAVLHAANFSPAMNVMLSLVRQAANLLPEPESVGILDIHHAGKQDAPSGTALALADALGPLTPSIDSVRDGDHIGEHRVEFRLADEHLALVHQAKDRDLFARGALAAAAWLLEQPPGLYSAQDWIEAGTRRC